MPDLVVIDGGKGQLSAAQDALGSLRLSELPLISLAKREEEIFTPGRSEPLVLRRRSPALRMLQQLRDEASNLFLFLVGEEGKGEWWRRRTTADKEAGDDERWRRQRGNQPANKG